jgi:hypothetical protein
MREESAQRADHRVAQLAARQHGIVTSAQLTASEVDRNGIHRRVQAGRFHRIHQGVYAVGHAGLSNEGRWMAAVLACGPGAVLSHRAAGALWEIIPVPSLVDVTVPGRAGRKRRNEIRLHRSTTLLAGHCTVRRGIPVTTPDRTLADLRRMLSREEFAEALRKAEYLRLPIGDRLQPDHTRSKLEARFLTLCRRHGLATPGVNVSVGAFRVDFLWRESRLVVEMDGWQAHGLALPSRLIGLATPGSRSSGSTSSGSHGGR